MMLLSSQFYMTGGLHMLRFLEISFVDVFFFKKLKQILSILKNS